MPRIVKKADVRRAEILDATYRLFARDGYEATTVNAILDELGISKGAFYHHFESKDEVMRALARRLAEEMRARIEPLMARPGLSSADKLNLFFSAGASFKHEHIPFVRVIAAIFCREENLRLRASIVNESMTTIRPLFAQLLDEGRRDGIFDIEDPVETARLLLHLATSIHDALGEAWQRAATDSEGAARQFRRRVDACARASERILGLGERTLSLIDDKTIDLFLKKEAAR